jgi:hypothetical protein
MINYSSNYLLTQAFTSYFVVTNSYHQGTKKGVEERLLPLTHSPNSFMQIQIRGEQLQEKETS